MLHVYLNYVSLTKLILGHLKHAYRHIFEYSPLLNFSVVSWMLLARVLSKSIELFIWINVQNVEQRVC